LREQTQPYEETINNNISVDACKIKMRSNILGEKGFLKCLLCEPFLEKGGGECLLWIFQKKGEVNKWKSGWVLFYIMGKIGIMY
jgi:hypothetical protein